MSINTRKRVEFTPDVYVDYDRGTGELVMVAGGVTVMTATASTLVFGNPAALTVGTVNDIALSTANTYTDAAVNAAVNAVIAEVNAGFAAIVAALEAKGISE